MAALLFGQQRLASISAWARNVNAPPPPLGGRWDDILAPVYRELRKNRQNLEVMERQVEGIMLAAEALPDGAMTLNDAMQMTWCNQTARDHLGLHRSEEHTSELKSLMRISYAVFCLTKTNKL